MTTQGSPDFVPLERRIATFELDKAWDEGLKRGWTIVHMKKEWKVIYPYEK